MLDAEQPDTLRRAYELLQDLDNYERIVEGTYEYGQQRLQELLELDHDDIAELDGYFRSWLISRGKEVYMNALQDPDSLASVPRAGEKLNFERFAYAPYYAYEAKLLQVDTGRQEDLFSALRQYALDEETVTDIRSELPQRPDIREDWSDWMLPKLFPGICKAKEPKDMEGLLNAGNLAFGYPRPPVEVGKLEHPDRAGVLLTTADVI